MQKIREALTRFMMGRYGIDQYAKFLLITALICDFISLLFTSTYFLILSDIIFIYAFFRMLSKNIVKRSMENQSYIILKNWFRHIFKAAKSNVSDKEHHYYVCPHCHQIVRVPKGRGKIDITCPTCGKEFSRKS